MSQVHKPQASNDLFASYADYLAEIEQALQLHLHYSTECPELLAESTSYSFQAGGKRLRPLLVVLACELCGTPWKQALPAASAIEMIHTYSLIHDDLPAMDDDDLRRGRPTNHVIYGEANAILAGDALLTRAFEILALHLPDPVVAVECIRILSRAAGAEGMVGGQVLDLAAEDPGCVLNQQELERVHNLKTGRMITASLLMGGVIAKADSVTLKGLETYGNAIGLAFQVADDLLDYTGCAESMGKQVQKDLKKGKATFPGLLGLEESRRYANNLIVSACQALEPWGDKAEHLRAIAHYIVERNR